MYNLSFGNGSAFEPTAEMVYSGFGFVRGGPDPNLTFPVFPVWGKNWFGAGSFWEPRGKKGVPHSAVDVFAPGGVFVPEPSTLKVLDYISEKVAWNITLRGVSGQTYKFNKQVDIPDLHEGQGVPQGWLGGFKGTPILAPVSGVIDKPMDREDGGWSLHLRGDDGIDYYMAHLSHATPWRHGQRVKAEYLLGHVGQSGNAGNVKAHLHLQTRPILPDGTLGAAVNPYFRLFELKKKRDGRYPWPPSFPVGPGLFGAGRTIGIVLGVGLLAAGAGTVGYLSYRDPQKYVEGYQQLKARWSWLP